VTDASQPSKRPARIGGWLRRPSWSLVQNLTLVAAAIFAFNGARVLNDSPKLTTPNLDNFDKAALWLGLALLALLAAAWPARRPKLTPREWPRALAAFWRAHRIEILFFVAIFAFGVFMRLYRFGGTLPSPNGLCCEEHINGGVAYKALQGDRPLNFLLTRWTAAGGFLIFGENTLGLRFFFPVLSIATLVAFYFLLRQLVSVPVALFGYTLFAAAWWPSLRARQASEGTIYAVLFALVLLLALRTKRPIWAMAAGVLAGLLSYEYEPFKAVPIIAAIFLVCAAGREVALRAPYTLDGARARVRALGSIAWRPMLVALMAAGIVLVPMVVGTHKGYDLYLTSVHRQESGREGNRFADNWQTQLKWAAEIFLPVGPNDYVASPPRDIAHTDLIDPVAAWLALAGLLVSILLLLRGVRALFVMWLVITLGAAATLLHDFGPWKFIVLMPVVITIATLFVEDARRLVARLWGESGVRVLFGLVALAAAFSMWWNADTLFNHVGPSQAVRASYGGEASLIYSVCHRLKDGADSYAFVSSGTPSLTTAFASRRDSPEGEARAWGDLVWACHGLQGRALAAPEELWPLRDVPNGPVAIVASDPASADELTALLSRVYPSLSSPVITKGPGGRYRYVMYRLPSGSALSQHGLWGDYTSTPDGALAPRVDDLSHLSWDASPSPVGDTFLVHWQGLIYVAQQTTAAVRVLTDASSYNVKIDGQFVSLGTSESSLPDNLIALVPGWHPIEVAASKLAAGGSLRLVWTTAGGGQQPVESQDLFPLQQLDGWLQTRTVGLPGGLDEQTTERLDFAPHYVSAATIALLAQHDGFEPLLAEERWRGVWQVDEAGEYTLSVQFPSGQVTLLVDGQTVVQSQEFNQSVDTIEVAVTLASGAHQIEIVQSLSTETDQAGVTISALRAGQPMEMRVTPY
jgi:hypothetical protein